MIPPEAVCEFVGTAQRVDYGIESVEYSVDHSNVRNPTDQLVVALRRDDGQFYETVASIARQFDLAYKPMPGPVVIVKEDGKRL